MKTPKFNHADFISIGTPLNSSDYNLFVGIVNKGIDSHLEGFTESMFFYDCGKFHFHFHRSEKHILLRRLNDVLNDQCVDDDDRDYISGWIEDVTNYDTITAD